MCWFVRKVRSTYVSCWFPLSNIYNYAYGLYIFYALVSKYFEWWGFFSIEKCIGKLYISASVIAKVVLVILHKDIDCYGFFFSLFFWEILAQTSAFYILVVFFRMVFLCNHAYEDVVIDMLILLNMRNIYRHFIEKCVIVNTSNWNLWWEWRFVREWSVLLFNEWPILATNLFCITFRWRKTKKVNIGCIFEISKS